MYNISLIPYSIQKTYLPVNSEIPQSMNENESKVFVSVLPLCIDVIQVASTIENEMLSQILGKSRLSLGLAALNQKIGQVFRELQNSYRKIVESTSFETSESAIRHYLSSKPEELIRGYVIYDNHFSVIRVADLSMLDFLAQIAKTSSMILDEIEFALLGRDEVLYIINNIKTMFMSLAEKTGPSIPETKVNLDAFNIYTDTRQAWKQAWFGKSGDSIEWTQTVADYRWIIGHHLFNLCSIFCGDYLARARKDFEENSEGEAVKNLRQAGYFLRGTTAAMWYAANMPADVYSSYIRQSMISEESPHGFSGEQNADFNRVKVARSALEDTVLRLYGSDRHRWSNHLRKAIEEFVEQDTLDGEAHTLIAAALTGMDASISQKQGQRGLPQEFNKLNAVDLLRELTIQRKESFGR